MTSTRKAAIARANPQISSNRYLIDSIKADSGSDYVVKDSVASLSSPAAYLTALYREARSLHSPDASQHLDIRRPDLQSLVLSDSNMNSEVSTLALSTEILTAAIDDSNLESKLALATWPCDLPYHAPFNAIASALALQGKRASDLNNLVVNRRLNPATESALGLGIAPALYNLLLESTDKSASPEKNNGEILNQLLALYGTKDITHLAKVETICQALGISRDRLNQALAISLFEQSGDACNMGNAPFLVTPLQRGARYINANSNGHKHFICNVDDTLMLFSGTADANMVDAKWETRATLDTMVFPVANTNTVRVAILYPQKLSVALTVKYFINNSSMVRTIKLQQSGQSQWLDLHFDANETSFIIREEDTQNVICNGEYKATFSDIDANSLLRLGKLLRLMESTQLSPSLIDRVAVISHPNTLPKLDQCTLTALAAVQDLMVTRGLSEQDALVLVGGDIDDTAHIGKVSQFDRLFNTPPLNGHFFSCNDGNFNFDPADIDSAQQRAVLKRAFGVNDLELYTLSQISPNDSKSLSLNGISWLYRLSLWASSNDLSPLELYEFTRIMFSELHASDIAPLEQFQIVCSGADWLTEQKLTVTQLKVMTTRLYSSSMTPQIDNFIQSLALLGLDSKDPKLKDKLAPFLAVAFGLSTDAARMLEDWYEKIIEELYRPEEIGETQIVLMEGLAYSALNLNNENARATGGVAECCQVLAQLALIIKHWNFSAAELELIANYPDALKCNLLFVLPDMDSLQLLSGYHSMVQSVSDADLLLRQLKQKNLSAKALADLLKVSVKNVQQPSLAAKIEDNNQSLTLADATAIGNWIAAAAEVNVSVDELAALCKLTLSDDISTWKSVAWAFSATVAPHKMSAFHEEIDEQVSTALSAWYLANKPQILPEALPWANREDLFSYLLIDNQVSAKVMTSRIAEAIAGIQLYVDRCLHGLEKDVNRHYLVDTPFFQGWDSINKRYSQWAAVQQLDYYPENYVDPTLRSQQSFLQKQLAQDLMSGNGMDGDSADVAFRHYLTGLETLAKMRIISGYHDGKTLDDGYTYFIGIAPNSPQDYYWRRLDQSEQSQNKEGTVANPYFAHSWSGWEKIPVPIGKLYRDAIRLVSTKDRLYLAWIEKIQTGSTQDKTMQSQPVHSFHLKLAWEHINGSWSIPVTVELDKQADFNKEVMDSETFQFYASYNAGHEQLLLMFYHGENQTLDYLYDNAQIIIVSPMLDVTSAVENDKLRIIGNISYDIRLDFKIGDGIKIQHALKTYVNNGLVAEVTVADKTENSLQYTSLGNFSVVVYYDFHSNSFILKESARLLLDYSKAVLSGLIHSAGSIFYHAPVEASFSNGKVIQIAGTSYSQQIINKRTVEIAQSEAKLKNSYIFKVNEYDFNYTIKNTLTKEYTLSIKALPTNHVDPIYLVESDKISGLMVLKRSDDNSSIPLNSLFGPELVKRVSEGIDNLLTLSTQQQVMHNEAMDFNGSYGLYFWELFYYSPLLQADHLLANRQFDEAERWMNTIFNPQGYIESGLHTSRYWNVLPFLEMTDAIAECGSIDPDIIAQNDPFHYKVHVLMRRLDLLQAKGDSLYRQLERDTLAEAKQCYLSALNLLGKAPELTLNATWPDPSLGQAACAAVDMFSPALNEKFDKYWKVFEQRLFNLRHNLSLDGQALHLALYAAPAAPMDLYRAIAAPMGIASASASDSAGSRPPQARYRYPQIAASAKELVAQLSQYGSQLLATLQQKDVETFNAQAQQQAHDLMQLSINVQTELVTQAAAQLELLKTQEDTIKNRKGHYEGWLAEGSDSISTKERNAMNLRISSTAARTSASAIMTAGFMAELAPNIFGFADGGCKWGSPLFGIGVGLVDGIGGVLDASATALDTQENYRRRKEQWQLMRDEAMKQLLEIAGQKKGAQAAKDAAKNQLTYLTHQKEDFKAQLDFVKSKFSNSALYDWLKGQLSTIYSLAYELAWSRCKMVEASFHWETQMKDKQFLQPIGEDHPHANLLRGERLMAALQQMDAAYLEWDARALEVTRTVSLAKEMKSIPGQHSFANLVNSILAKDTEITQPDGLKISLDNEDQLAASIILSDLNIKDDYPEALGTSRRIKQIGVSLPALIGPYQDVQAVLSYQGADISLDDSCRRIAISHGVDDAGMFQWSFQDSKYLPFEGIPIDDAGSLVLSFPNATGKQAELVNSLSDIILHIRYTIRNND
ncbi:neuraminidase-like domain-containing protein [Shewanella frigidimarina]|uniref:Tc toxin subunit A-related protein n=1 Tax=Shewanella frigidimarina TaxID=56812 RepID=UPI0031760AA4